MAKKKLSLQEWQQLALTLAGRGGTLSWPPLSDDARRRIQAEVRARWPYYRKAKAYRKLAREMEQLQRCIVSTVNPLTPSLPKNSAVTKTKEYSALAQGMEKLYRELGAFSQIPPPWPPEASAIADKVTLVLQKVQEQFGMLLLIPLEASVEDILQIEAWSIAFFPAVLIPAYSDVREPIPTEREAKIRYLLEHGSSLPVQLNLLRPKGEILAAVEGIIENWQNRMKEVGIRFGKRYREPDYDLFPRYVEAYGLREQGKSLRQIRDRLFPGEEAGAAERKAELYIQNGKLLVQGQSDLIGQR